MQLSIHEMGARKINMTPDKRCINEMTVDQMSVNEILV